MRRLIAGSATAVLVATTLVTGIADLGVDQLDRTVQAFLESRRGTWHARFLSHLKALPDAVTTFDNSSRAGISISCKRSNLG